ncbi:MAG TPA: hypothetical protein VNY05_31825 [Candidatus Acidoferrales bacterium]|nr:hypothetical protein [Candidatus Acidoferrales bacterium]
MSGCGAYLTIGVGLIERATATLPPESEVKDFIERCPPFKALLVALCFSQYDRCIRGPNERWLGEARPYDMFMAVYLPYCRSFVTRDKGQHKALTAVADLIGCELAILTYEQFKASLFGFTVEPLSPPD